MLIKTVGWTRIVLVYRTLIYPAHRNDNRRDPLRKTG
jgi:hypothetical protein